MTSLVSLQSNISTSLSALQDIAGSLATSQARLATGKKVNSALDNPLSYAVSQSLNDRSSSLSSLLDGMSNGIQTVQAANKGADSIYTSLSSLKGLVSQAQSAGTTTTQATGTTGTLTAASAFTGASGDKLTITNSTDNSTTNIDISGATTVQGVLDAVNSGTGGNYSASIVNGSLSITAAGSRSGQSYTASVTNGGTLSGTKTTALFNQATAAASATTGGPSQATLSSIAKQMNDLMDSIGKTAGDSGYNGVNLLSAGSTMTVKYNKDGSSSSTVNGQDMSLSGLGLTKFATPSTVTLSQISAMSTQLDAASDSVRGYQGTLSTGLSIIQNRTDFSKGMIDILDTGSANLVNADVNSEAAKVVALQTRQSLSQSALSLANQANQGVLQLLR